ncbi:polysaccharide biosynthesis protein [Paenibacillus algicola]|uniref:Polysaccharide biosynthesis protein n=1 Tax=Paenibacillus algicola TaxID=2565926 RepID=A0A4P8XQP7_9BACL|nr:polysaccharide biosynthesis protein [Paenibacillus sp. F411]QCT04180.1 polysaccharide biosynthesis protein [Paenibacillus algicola]
MAKDSFIKGTIILAAAALVARVLGIAQRIPLEHLLDDIGQSAFASANNIYLILLALATAGVPSTLSKMVSERYAMNRPAEAKRVYQAALYFSAGVGVVITLLLFFFAPYYARLTKLPEATAAIQALAPALLLFPTIAMMRGYFQGRNFMTPGGISQIVEQIARVVTGIGLAYILIHFGYNDPLAAAGATFGGVLGSLAAFAVMLAFALRLRRQDKLNHELAADTTIPLGTIYKAIFTLSIPIVLSSVTVPSVNFLDTSLVKPLLNGVIGPEEATAALAVLGTRAQSIAGIPPILAVALAQSLIPIISAAYARKDEQHLQHQVTLALRVAILSGMPVVLVLAAAAYSLNGLLFSSIEGTGIIMMLTLTTIFQITMVTSGSILLGTGKAKITVKHVIVGLLVKLAGSYLLSPLLGIYGIIAATALCFLVITILNVRTIKSIVSFSILGTRWIAFGMTVLIAFGAGYGTEGFSRQLVNVMPDRLAFLIVCAIVGIVVGALYLLLLIILGVVRQAELKGYPRVLQKVLRPLMRLAPSAFRQKG